MRKKIILFLLLIFLFSLNLSAKDKRVEVLLFYSPTCKACFKVKMEIIPRILKKYKDKMIIKEANIYDKNNLNLLISLSSRFKRKIAATPSLLVGDSFLVGTKEIEENLDEAIEKALKKKIHFHLYFSEKALLDKFREITLLTLIGAGLVDGINPCAFAVIVFFISFLTVYGYGKKEIIGIGSAYVLAVFFTYLFLGLGIFKTLYLLSRFYLLIKLFYYLVAGLCFFLFILALYDYFRFRKEKTSEGFLLQLPKFLKKKITGVIGDALRKKKTNYLRLFFISLGVGFLVSLLEAVCTGQVYLPTIFFILKIPHLRFKALLYLVVYNLMFIFPLIVIFLLFLLGISSQTFNNFLKKHLGIFKLALASVFLGLGLFILLLS
ncbi:MAG: hypothetical protein B6D56_02810 [Candidatus Omnitrophica bacterium 4484_70.1]|nr:MAG: hypothetical protein B6D56_02810 [Candidatus Omnitrophica bacterium 4484_70.1]